MGQTPSSATDQPAHPQWREDILGPAFRVAPIPVDEPDTYAAVIAPALPATTSGATPENPATTSGAAVPAATAVVYVHGWSDYFFHHHLADHYSSLGIAFYAVDLRRYGRGLLIDAAGGPEHWEPAASAAAAETALPAELGDGAPITPRLDDYAAGLDAVSGARLTGPQSTAGYIEDLAAYDVEIDAAIAIARAENPGAQILVHGHSTGGLVLALWAARHPGQAAGLLLNSPWLEFQFDAAMRKLLTAWMGVRQKSPKPLRVHGPNFSTLATASLGRLPYDLRLKPTGGFPVYPAWLRAVFAGHQQVAGGLHLDIPVLVQAAAASQIRWGSYTPSMAASDVVLDVDVVIHRALTLGPAVTIERIPGAMHDVFVSAPAARRQAYDGITRFLFGTLSAAHLPESPRPSAAPERPSDS